MNELRWILLGLGIVVIAGIYFWESYKQKRYIRSRIENYPSISEDRADLSIKPGRADDETDNINEAIADLSNFLNETRQDIDPDIAASADGTDPDAARDAQESRRTASKDPAEQKIIALFITAKEGMLFNGAAVANSLSGCGMEFGTMDIFHYPSPDNPDDHLFSLANMHEPGTFDPDNMADFTTDGLAMFACLPAGRPGAEVFDGMLDCARAIASDLDADLRDGQHQVMTRAAIDNLRQQAAQYT